MSLPRIRAPGRLTRTHLRLALLSVIVLSGAFLAYGSTTGPSTASEDVVPRAPPTENHTVVTESGRAGTITAYRPNGSVMYYNNTHTKYFDVDPTAEDPLTVEYAATDTVHAASPNCADAPCARNVLERVDLRTGEVEVLYEQYDYKETAGEWHDVDRINDTHVVVADIAEDRVFVVDLETELVRWAWDAQSAFPLSGGGPYPRDWAHINDVESLDDGRIVVSLRNQDQVVFLDTATGVEDDWTLGAENDHDVLHEQHNPDYVPPERGGPALVVADSENGRVQEFQREDGEWVRSWEWSDDRMQWPRDADRLPGGTTLVVDTHGNRVLELDREGEIVWSVPSTLPYDAERLETGDESAGGESARRLGLASRRADDGGDGDGGGGPDAFDPLGAGSALVHWLLPSRVVNAVLFVSPVWMGRPEFAALAAAVLSGLGWTGLECRWQFVDRGLRLRWPVARERED